MRVTSDAVEIVRNGSGNGLIFFTCEHASELLPEPYRWPVADRRLIGTHWAYDIGARDLALRLGAENDGIVVLSRFTRLLIDPNRGLEEDTLFRATAEGKPVELNRDLSPEEREQRISRFYRPFHDTIHEHLAQSPAPIMIAVHSFTPLYEGQPRTVELGVLFDREEERANQLRDCFEESGLRGVGMNIPYSGKDGLLYSAEGHARRHGREALEIEVRQDRILESSFQTQVAAGIARFARCLA